MTSYYVVLSVTIIAANLQCYGLASSPMTRENPTLSPSDAVVSHACAQNLEDRSANCSSKNLHEVPQDLYPNIQKLILTDNNITVLKNSSFLRYPLIYVLDLDMCEICYIESGAFYPLRHLKRLVLTAAVKIDALNGGLFLYSDELQYVDVGVNAFESIPCEILLIPNLKTLGLVSNSISSVNITCGKNIMDSIDLSSNTIGSILQENFIFDCQTNVLILDDNPIRLIDPYTIASLPVQSLSLSGYPLPIDELRSLFLGVSNSLSIQELFLTDGAIPQSYIPRDLFDPLHNKSLSTLDLQGNDFVLYPLVFFNLACVSALYLTTDGQIEPSYFDGMIGLRDLIVGDDNFPLELNPYNSIWKINLTLLEIHLQTSVYRGVNLTQRTFKGLDSLTTLIIIDTEANAFSSLNLNLKLPNVEYLYLDVSIGKYYLQLDTPRMKILSCGDHIIGEFRCTVENFEGAQSLEKLYMSHALTINFTTTFEGLYNLTYLDVSYNYIEMIPPCSFVNLSLLEILDLNANFLTSITSDTFNGLISLRMLKLEQNQLLHIASDSLKNLNYLTNLHLDRNHLNYLHTNLFAGSFKLTTLTLAYNQFVMLNRHTFDPIFSTLKFVDISGNMLICNCESRWIVDNLGGALIHDNDTLCSVNPGTLEPVRGKSVLTFIPSKYCPAITPYCVICFAVLSMFTISIVLYRNSYILKYKLYLLKLAILGYVEIQDARDRDEFEYDVNIMFTDNDTQWATDNFRPELQERIPEMHRIAFGDDELMLGMHYLDAVYYNVEKSFKTVLLLSRAAVHDHIFMTKFRIAMNHVTDTQTENMVLVFIEDIPDNEIPYLVRLYQTGRGEHLRWEADEENQEYLWYRLTKILPVNLKINNLIPP